MDIVRRRQKQQELMIRMLERKVRERAQQLYEERGQAEGKALDDWVKAESEVLDRSIVAPLYRRTRTVGQDPAAQKPQGSPLPAHVADECESPA